MMIQQVAQEKPHKVTIAWGTDGENKSTYNFGTEAELEAFLKGVDEGTGWIEYDVVEEPDGSRCAACSVPDHDQCAGDPDCACCRESMREE